MSNRVIAAYNQQSKKFLDDAKEILLAKINPSNSITVGVPLYVCNILRLNILHLT
jgi:hypothetical protein